jgi:hypothetical protein
VKTIGFTGFLPLSLSRFSQSRTSIQRTSPSEFWITSSTGNTCAIQSRACCSSLMVKISAPSLLRQDW